MQISPLTYFKASSNQKPTDLKKSLVTKFYEMPQTQKVGITLGGGLLLGLGLCACPSLRSKKCSSIAKKELTNTKNQIEKKIEKKIEGPIIDFIKNDGLSGLNDSEVLEKFEKLADFLKKEYGLTYIEAIKIRENMEKFDKIANEFIKKTESKDTRFEIQKNALLDLKEDNLTNKGGYLRSLAWLISQEKKVPPEEMRTAIMDNSMLHIKLMEDILKWN